MAPFIPPRFGRRAKQAFSLAGLAGAVLRRSLTQRFPHLDVTARLAMVPQHAEGLSAPITIRWNDQHVPLVDAATDRDAATGLGIVHGHLRLAQMEIMRRAAYGRIAEIAGSAAVELDTLLRLVDFPRSAEPSLAMLPDATRDWAEGFAAGLSAASAVRPVPPEFAILGIEPEPWTVEDVFAVSRLCSADYAWKVWRTLNGLRQEDDWARMWTELVGVVAVADEDIPIETETLEDAVPTAFTRMGSNCYVLGPERTATGAPLLACDPHHLVTSPSLWLIAGFRTPDITVWGFMIPALPIFGVGRNSHGAWGGTNLHATSSELVDVAGEPIETRTAEIPLRGGKTHEVMLRESRLGPVISDAKPFKMDAETVALHWMGHRPTDEFTPFYRLMHASDWKSFADAIDLYSLPGLNMLWAGNGGEIGKMLAVRVPKRPLGTPRDLVISMDEAHEQWANLLSPKSLPIIKDPPKGFITSANEAPTEQPVTISLFYSADTRVDRLAELFGDRDDFTAEDLKTFQTDVYHAPAHALAPILVAAAQDAGVTGPVIDAIRDWDGDYAADSAGALAFELVAAPLITHLEERSAQRFVSPHWRPFSRLERLVQNALPADLGDGLRQAVETAEGPFGKHKTWGGLHKVRLAHPFAKLPWLGPRLPQIEFPSGGSNDTLMKSMHPFTQKVHATNFAANARFVADLADPDGTWAVLLGGQDGWPASRTMFDQLGQWRRGDYIQLPMTDAAIADAFPRETSVTPA